MDERVERKSSAPTEGRTGKGTEKEKEKEKKKKKTLFCHCVGGRHQPRIRLAYHDSKSFR
jgi:hypothetical protein